MYLHILYNDKKFNEATIRLFESAAPGENRYVVFGAKNNAIPEGTEKIETVEDFEGILASECNWVGIFFHPLTFDYRTWLNRIPRNIPIVWYRYGHEAYGLHPKLKKTLYLPETKNVIKKLYSHHFIKQAIKGALDELSGRFNYFKRVDFFVGPEREEFNLFRSAGLFSPSAEWICGRIFFLEDLLDWTSNEIKTPGQDIRVGHSANPSGNHIDAFRWLSRFDLTGRKVIVPLSYGDVAYAKIVMKKGAEILGDYFEPITNFLPLHEYTMLMDRCGFAVMNHLRQQGGGNITYDLWRGAKIYMNKTTSYEYRKNIGFSVELITDQSQEQFFSKKGKEQILNDRKILLSIGSRGAVIETAQNVLANCRRFCERKSAKKS